MKTLFGPILLALIGLSLLVWATQPPPPPPGKLSLVWVSDDNPLRKEQRRLFERLYPNRLVNLDPSNGGVEKVIVQSLAGVGPDLFDVYGEADFAAYVDSGIAWDLTEALRRRGVDVRRDTWPATYPISLRGDRVFAVPTNAGADAVWLNSTLFARAGVPLPKPPWTPDEFVRVAQRLTIRERSGRPVQYGVIFDIGSWTKLLPSFGGRMYTPDGRRSTIGDKEAIAALQWVYDLLYKYRVTPTPVEEAAMVTSGAWGKDMGPMTYFLESKGAMAFGGRWWLAKLRDRPELRLAAVEPPFAIRRATLGYGRATMINRLSPRRDQALDFVLYLASPGYNRLLNHQADALAPFRKYSYEPGFLQDPHYPRENYNKVWRSVTEMAVDMGRSSYVNQKLADRILGTQVDLVKNKLKSPAEALREAARQIDAEIAKNLARARSAAP